MVDKATSGFACVTLALGLARLTVVPRLPLFPCLEFQGMRQTHDACVFAAFVTQFCGPAFPFSECMAPYS